MQGQKRRKPDFSTVFPLSHVPWARGANPRRVVRLSREKGSFAQRFRRKF